MQWYIGRPKTLVSLINDDYLFGYALFKRLLLQTANLIRLFRYQELLFLPQTFAKPL
jgi:hypothetical protein